MASSSNKPTARTPDDYYPDHSLWNQNNRTHPTYVLRELDEAHYPQSPTPKWEYKVFDRVPLDLLHCMDESEWIRHCEIVEDWADEQADTMLAELAALKERVEAKLDDPPKNSEKGKEKSKENGDGGKRYGRTEEYLGMTTDNVVGDLTEGFWRNADKRIKV